MLSLNIPYTKIFMDVSDRIINLYWNNKLTSPLFKTLTEPEINLMHQLYVDGEYFPLIYE